MTARTGLLVLAASGIAACLACPAPAGEVVWGKVKMTYTNAGRMSISYDGVAVARDFHMRCWNSMSRDTRIEFGFPLKGPAARIAPKVRDLSDDKGRNIGSVITWDLSPTERPNPFLAPGKPHFVRFTITDGRITVHIRCAPAYPSRKGSGQMFLPLPKATYIGGSYFSVGYPKPVSISRKFPPPGDKKRFPGLRGCNSRNGCTLVTAPGPKQFQVLIEPSYGKIGLYDGDRWNTDYLQKAWVVRTGVKWFVDQSFTLEFKAGPPAPVQQAAPVTAARASSPRLPAPPAVQVAPPASGYWKLDEGSGAIVSDSLGHYPDARIVGPVQWAEGRFGKALKFSSSGCVIVPRPKVKRPPPKTPLSFTVSAWFRMAEKQRLTYTGVVSAISYNKGVTKGFGLNFRGKRLFFVVNSLEMLRTAKTVNDDTWHHAAGVYDAAKREAALWLDGVRAGTKRNVRFAPGGTPIMFGPYYGAAGGGSLNGLLDEIRIFDKALSGAEIKKLYSAQTQ